MKTSNYQAKYANRFFRTVLVSVLVLLCIYSSIAQNRSGLSRVKYKGFEASFGNRSFQVNSTIAKIDGMKGVHEGGSLGVILGNDLMISRIKLGYFSSNSNTPHVQEIFEGSIQMNLYPLGLIEREIRLRPYFTAGFSMDNVKFYGTYLDQGNAANSAYDPLLGKISQLNLIGGAGVGYSLSKYNDFISLFAEMNTVLPLNASANSTAFQQTSFSKFTTMSIGIRFGLNSRNLNRSSR